MSNLFTPFSTAPLDDAAERRIRELIEKCCNADITVQETVRTAWREGAEFATEAAARKCEAVADNLDKFSVAAGQAAQECAAAIRGGKL